MHNNLSGLLGLILQLHPFGTAGNMLNPHFIKAAVEEVRASGLVTEMQFAPGRHKALDDCILFNDFLAINIQALTGRIEDGMQQDP